jgi:hypothetical protein
MLVVAIIRIGDRLPLPAPRHGRAAATARPLPSAGRSASQVGEVLRVERDDVIEAAEVLGLTCRARRCEMSTPFRAATAIARGSGGRPTCQSPVPALSISTSRPSRSASRRNAASASGERQMLPRQTNSTDALIDNARFPTECLLAAAAERATTGDSMLGRPEARNRAAARSPRRVGAYAWYALFVLVLVYIVNFIDRQILSILVGDIKRDLGVSDAQIGFLYGTAFAVFYALFGIPLGRLADSWYRGRLMAMGLALWSSMTAFSGFANSFGMLAAARIGVGIGEASASPAAYSMISDSFPKERRATALSIYSSGLYIGGALSLPIGGFVVSRWNTPIPIPACAARPRRLAGRVPRRRPPGPAARACGCSRFASRSAARPTGCRSPSSAPMPGAIRRELIAILPPLTLFNVARFPGELRPTSSCSPSSPRSDYGLYRLTGDGRNGWPTASASTRSSPGSSRSSTAIRRPTG